MNGDGIPELHLSTGHGNSYEIYTYYNQEVMLWYRGVDYNYPLENRAMGYIRYGAAPRISTINIGCWIFGAIYSFI